MQKLKYASGLLLQGLGGLCSLTAGLGAVVFVLALLLVGMLGAANGPLPGEDYEFALADSMANNWRLLRTVGPYFLGTLLLLIAVGWTGGILRTAGESIRKK